MEALAYDHLVAEWITNLNTIKSNNLPQFWKVKNNKVLKQLKYMETKSLQ